MDSLFTDVRDSLFTDVRDSLFSNVRDSFSIEVRLSEIAAACPSRRHIAAREKNITFFFSILSLYPFHFDFLVH
ncbi:hypothetical protein ACSAZK_02905 [Methanosarcina sp. Mfa9]|uniref:hypothetical protein n=1 Tax=Methanosarcina sp. Mfa9 TaxID=3439063 RepID=UPI003F84E0A9